MTVVSGVAPFSSFPRLSESNWSYQRPTASSWLLQLERIRIVAPNFSSAKCDIATYCNTGFSETGDSRKRRVIAAAPSSKRTTSIPTSEAGKSPTAVKTEKRPPTPSGIPNTSGQPSVFARLASFPLAPVIGTTRSAICLASPPTALESSLRKSRVAAAVSRVPPLLLTTSIAH